MFFKRRVDGVEFGHHCAKVVEGEILRVDLAAMRRLPRVYPPHVLPEGEWHFITSVLNYREFVVSGLSR